MDGLAKSGKTAKAVDQVAKALERAKTQMAAIDKFDVSRGSFAAARQRYRDAQVAVEGAARAMKGVAAPTREMEQNLRRAQSQVRATAKAFDMQKDAVLANKRALQGMGVDIQQAAAHHTRLRKAVEQTGAVLEREERRAVRRQNRQVAISGAAAAVGAFAGHEVKAGARAVAHTYREFDRERRFAKAVMGISDEEQGPLVKQAIHMGATTKFNDIQVLEAQRELAARGVKRDQIMGMMGPAASLGSALDLKLPDAVKQMEGAIFGFKKSMGTLEEAQKSAQQTADYQVKAAKISGMTPEDIQQLYKFGATPARMGKISEASLLGFGGILKKANIGGDEAGVAFRALMSTAQAPTAGAKTALLANGLNYKNYQRVPDNLAVDPFAEDVAARYGVKLDKGTRAGLGKIFADKAMISDPAKFNPAVTALLRDKLEGTDAKSLKSIAGAAGRYRDKSVNEVDTNAFIKDLIPKLANNLPLANALFGSKQGGRIATALGDGDTLKHIIGEIEGGSEGYAGKIAAERMAGFDGAVSRFEGAVKNLETAVGRAFDADGKGGLLTKITDLLGQAIQKSAELPPGVVAGGAIAAGVAGKAAYAYGGYKLLQLLTTGGGLTSSAVALDASAAALTSAAAVLSGSKAAGAAASAAASAGTTAAGAGVGSALWATAAPALPFVAAGAATVGGLYAMHKSVEDAGYEGLTSGERLRRQRGGSMRDMYRRAWGYPMAPDVPEVSPTMTYGTGVGGAGGGKVDVGVQGEVHGEVENKVTVEAGSSLLEVVKQAQAAIRLAGTINNGNGPGSLGHSSPDAAAPAPAISGKQGPHF
ncbi:phage tail tape measure protein [Bradyrhizobium australafricanum]|uniref:phage tail tape measure protein n=1 Tax=Bradyrhizobium australafricanum TaxID=2821406 RepID=UPI001CE30B09|nr:phage tail tape measure protein [Bradyrhizobium australafricanum]MCA6099194.1 phage tail tape measure protein [Bradyrhizobium australafricanum]